MESLEKLFGSAAKVKIMRLFILNAHQSFTTKLIADRAKVSTAQARREVVLLWKAGFVKKTRSAKQHSYVLNEKFELLQNLERMLFDISPIGDKEMINKLGRVAKLKLLVLSGIFVGNEDSKADIVIVGDQINKTSLKKAISTFESFLGKELRYAALSGEEFKYRYNVGDRLVRDLFDYSHRIVVNKLGEFFKKK